VRVLPADTLEPTALRELFNEGFSDYLVPMRMDAATFADHVRANDVDLACSRVMVDERPVAFALIARRGPAAWVGGMGTAPSHRRRGLGERALVAGLDAAREHGCEAAWLEVIDGNSRAVALYEELGFAVVRELIVWALPAGRGALGSREVSPEQAQAWIAAHRLSPEPWQRTDESLAAMARAGAPLRGLVVERGGEVTGAAVVRERAEAVTVLQIAAVDASAAHDLLLAAAEARPLRLSNAPAGEPVCQALEEIGADVVLRQHEMRVALA
jgi:GNAT superfamily N-acetyltransferase